MIVVTGATGNVGVEVARGLSARGVKVRAMVRDAARAGAQLDAGIERAVADFSDKDSVRQGVEGADALFLATPNHPLQADFEIGVIDAAAAAGVKRIIKLSAIGAQIGSRLEFWDVHGRSERHLQASGVDFVLLRPSFYMTNVFASLDQIRNESRMFAPAGGAKIAMIDPRDVADVAVAALIDDVHGGETLVLTGPEAMTFDDVADELSRVLDRPVAFVNVPDDAAEQALVAAGAPEWFARQLVILFGLLRGGAAESTTDTVRAVTGHEPRTFARFVNDHARLFAG